MKKYILKRLLLMVPVLLASTFLVFFIVELTPGNPSQMMLGKSATPEAIEKLNVELGLNDPFVLRYFKYISKAVRGDLGNSYVNQAPVLGEFLSRFPVTMKVAFMCVFISIIIGIPIGIIAAIRQYSFMDALGTTFAMVLASIPDFWLGMLLIIVFSLNLKWLPAMGVGSFKHYILPAFTLAAVSTATLIRMMRSTLLEVIRQDYVRTAKAKGASEKRVVFKHAIKNAMLPVVTVIGGDVAGLLGGAVLVETVFGMPGVGSLLVKGIRAKDVPMILGCVMMLAFIGGIVNLIVDISYAYIDPRIRSQYE